MNKIVVCGAGGFGREVAWLIERINGESLSWDLLGFVDDTEGVVGSVVNDLPVLGNTSWFETQTETIYAVCAVGSSRGRKAWIEKISKYPNVKFATVVDPKAIVSDRVSVGQGTIICAGTIATVNIEIGEHVILNLDCTVGHDAVIGDYCTINPSVNISGNVLLSEAIEIGTGANLIQGVKVGKNTVIGAGSVVTKDLPESCTAVGAPAKPIKFHDK